MRLTGLDVCVSERFERFRGQRVGLVCNQASIAQDFSHSLDRFLEADSLGVLTIDRAFGPQHGIWGHTQDNMVEWEGYLDSRTGLRFYSLYGEHRAPTDESLQGLDRLVFDVPDIGARYYTFIWTMANCMAACERLGLPFTVLDRPNPIGSTVEGTVTRPGFESFVGLHPLPTRHGLTVGEVARHLQVRHYPNCELDVVKMAGWDRQSLQDEAGWAWAMPSPNIPTVDTAVVYPGQCLLEGTNLSEGRGTTRPFETCGAPWLDGWALTERLDRFNLPGVRFRPVVFQPTFQKFADEVCGGCFIHVVDRSVFKSVLTSIAILMAAREMGGLEWRQPPYEYETVRLPIDILAGNDWLRESVDRSRPLAEIEERMAAECQAFEPDRNAAVLY